MIDGLVRDANQIIGVSNDLFGENVGAGLRSLNPGIAQGKLAMAAGRQTTELNKNGIYLLPETVSELPPVAGILTEGEGKSAVARAAVSAKILAFQTLVSTNRSCLS